MAAAALHLCVLAMLAPALLTAGRLAQVPAGPRASALVVSMTGLAVRTAGTRSLPRLCRPLPRVLSRAARACRRCACRSSPGTCWAACSWGPSGSTCCALRACRAWPWCARACRRPPPPPLEAPCGPSLRRRAYVGRRAQCCVAPGRRRAPWVFRRTCSWRGGRGSRLAFTAPTVDRAAREPACAVREPACAEREAACAVRGRWTAPAWPS